MSLAWEANDLYGGGRQPAQIKDPGRAGTIRQNQCNRSIPNQAFVLTR
jgi:hypothetical protein